jgi:PIN domain nuclease of toxin-antitoxin system
MLGERIRELYDTPEISPEGLEDAEIVRFVSPISLMGIAIKANRGLAAYPETFGNSSVRSEPDGLPITAGHLMPLFGLPPPHHDAFDGALIAVALAESIPILIKDR